MFALRGWRAGSIARLATALDVSAKDIENALDELHKLCETRRSRLQRQGNKLQMVTAPEMAERVQKFLGLEATNRLSTAALETLAIIAYKQPITKPQLEMLRGVNCDGVVNTLEMRSLIQDLGKADTVGHPTLYGVSFDFLQYFGLKGTTSCPPLRNWPRSRMSLHQVAAPVDETPASEGEMLSDAPAPAEAPSPEETQPSADYHPRMNPQRFLVAAGLGSRRACDKLIKEGRVTVNGQPLVFGMELGEGDDVRVDGRPLRAPEPAHVYLMLNKPAGYISDRGSRLHPAPLDFVKISAAGLHAAGRLDQDATGLLFLTNDGELSYRLTHPKFEHEKSIWFW